jgi:hypothetical protein|tara:strand:- start:520 stop:681 length:162 start_codon:yes stop_codon:yes gene_type:complete
MWDKIGEKETNTVFLETAVNLKMLFSLKANFLLNKELLVSNILKNNKLIMIGL